MTKHAHSMKGAMAAPFANLQQRGGCHWAPSSIPNSLWLQRQNTMGCCHA